MFDLRRVKKLDTTMSFRAMGLKRSLGVIGMVTVAGVVTVTAQMAKPPVAAMAAARLGQDYAPAQQQRVIEFFNQGSVTTMLVAPPALGSTGGGSTAGGTDWLKVEWHYSVNPADPKKLPWIDEVQFKVYVEGRDLYAANAPGQEGVAVCLTGEVTYVNLAQSRDAYGCVFLHPSTLARYAGTRGPEDFERKYNVRVEAYVGGKMVDYQSKNPNDKGGPDWNKGLPSVTNMLMQQDKTPFIAADTNRYPMIKGTSGAGAGGGGQ